MDFGDCEACSQYRYLEDGTHCPSCINIQQDEEWVVILHYPHMASKPQVIETGLTEREAKERVDGDARLIARKRADYEYLC